MSATDAGNKALPSDGLHTEPLEIQMGPSHPATHGTVRIKLTLDGERVVDSEVEVGYLHRGFEKECEAGEYDKGASCQVGARGHKGRARHWRLIRGRGEHAAFVLPITICLGLLRHGSPVERGRFRARHPFAGASAAD